MIKRLITFQCEICNSAYPGKEAARSCEAQGLRGKVPGVVVGSVVESGDSYGYCDTPDTGWVRFRTDEDIIAEQGYKTIHCHAYVPQFVVTRIDTRAHEVRYHLFCASPPWAKNQETFNFRWTTPATHVSMKVLAEGDISEAITTWKSTELEKWAPRVARDLL